MRLNPIVAILGRPNVGKSTLFNRLTRTQDAIVDDQPGVTRDRHYGRAEWNGVDFTVVDTGGFADEDEFSAEIRLQIQQAIDEADMIVLVLDGKGGVSPFDRDLVDALRGVSKPVLHAVNKIDGPEQEGRLADFYRLGVASLYPISAEHRYGMNDFLDDLVVAVQENIREIGPSILFFAPRLWENINRMIQAKITDTSALRRWIYRLFLPIGYKTAEYRSSKKGLGPFWGFIHQFAHWFLFRPLKDRVGLSQIRCAYTAGSAVSPEILNYFQAIGVNIKQLYGGSEQGLVTIHLDGEIK